MGWRYRDVQRNYLEIYQRNWYSFLQLDGELDTGLVDPGHYGRVGLWGRHCDVHGGRVHYWQRKPHGKDQCASGREELHDHSDRIDLHLHNNNNTESWVSVPSGGDRIVFLYRDQSGLPVDAGGVLGTPVLAVGLSNFRNGRRDADLHGDGEHRYDDAHGYDHGGREDVHGDPARLHLHGVPEREYGFLRR